MSETVCRSGPDADSHGRCPDSKVSQVKLLSHVRLFSTPCTIAYQAPPSMGFSRQEYWSGVPFPSPEDLSKPGIEPKSPTLQADSLPSEPPGKPQPGADLIQTVTCIICYHYYAFIPVFWASLVAWLVKNLPAMWETWVRSLGWEDPLKKGKATHYSILAWRIPWTL